MIRKVVDDNVHDLGMVDHYILSRLPCARSLAFPILVLLVALVVVLIVLILNRRFMFVGWAGIACSDGSLRVTVWMLLLLLRNELDLAQELGEQVLRRHADIEIRIGEVLAASVSTEPPGHSQETIEKLWQIRHQLKVGNGIEHH